MSAWSGVSKTPDLSLVIPQQPHMHRSHPGINLTPSFKTLEVVICGQLSPEGPFNLAKDSNFLTDLGSDFYKCKRILAENLNLAIICEYPMIAK